MRLLGIAWILLLTSSAANAQTASAMSSNAVFWAALTAALGSLLVLAFGKVLEIAIDLRRRRQRSIDLLCALHAEILAGVGASGEQITPDEQAYALSDSSPFATPDENDFVFSSVKDDISVLPQQVIHSVVAYYRKALQSNAMTKDLRDPCFLAQAEGQKRKFVGQLLDVAKEQNRIGRAALREIEAAALGFDIDLAERAVNIHAAIAARPANGDTSGQRLDGSDHGVSPSALI